MNIDPSVAQIEIPPDSFSLAEAYAACERLAREHYENFPVASRLLPARLRPHVAALYAFARTADDFADEGNLPPAERLRLLGDWEARLHRTIPSPSATGTRGTEAADAVFAALGHSIETCRLPIALFDDLLSAFRQDVTVTRYETWEDVLDYCRRSANPVGRLVLRMAGYEDAALDRSSDALCTALQLTNFWQDLAVDWRRGRLYVPMQDLRTHRAHEDDLSRGRLTPEWKAVLRIVADRTSILFESGREVCRGVPGRLGFELRLTWLGGMRILERLERSGFDVFDQRPTLGRADVPGLLWRALTWR